VPNAHGYLPVQQPYGQSGQPDPANQVAAALAPYVDRSVGRHLSAAHSQQHSHQEQSLQLVEAVTNTMLRAQEQSAAHIAKAYEQASGNPNLQQQHQPRSAPEVLLLQDQRSQSAWFRDNDGWFVLLVGASLATVIGVGTWLIASVVLSGMRSQPTSQPTRLSPAYPSSATPFN